MPRGSEAGRPTRRDLLKSALIAVPLVLGRPRRLLALGRLNVAFVGVGGKGESNLREIASAPGVRVAALCDVDARALAAAAERHPGARTFADYRLLIEGMDREIDAVVVSTPDHMHGPVAVAALRHGKHVYCEKPIAHNLHEVRLMTDLAKERRVVTQMGTQIHSHAAYRTAVASVRAGLIGRVREAHLWVSKSWSGPPGGRPAREDPVPGHLAWDLWLGVAPARPYVEGLYHQGSWRGWRDFGCGTLGDMGCHIFDPEYSALDLKSPRRVVSSGPAHEAETFAGDGDILYEFGGTARTSPTLRFRWTDGKSRPDAEKAELPPGTALPAAGSFLVGEKAVMVVPHWSMPKLYKGGRALDLPLVREDDRNHYHEWAKACQGEGTTSTPFSYAGPLTEAVLLGTIAAAFPGQALRFDADRLRLDHPAAHARIARVYREGWGLDCH